MLNFKLTILKILGWKYYSKGVHGSIFVSRKFDKNGLFTNNNKKLTFDFFTLEDAFNYQFKYLPFILLVLTVILFKSISN